MAFQKKKGKKPMPTPGAVPQTIKQLKFKDPTKRGKI